MKLKFTAAALLFAALAAESPSYAEIDYKEFQEDPLETAIRRLTSPAVIAWDKEEMLSGGAPEIVQEAIWPIHTGRFRRGLKRSGRRHNGIDISAPRGVAIYAVLDGIVEVSSYNPPGFRGYGYVIVINHDGKMWSLYSHNSVNHVKVGQRVKQGDVIAAVGSSGRSTGNHLHFELRNEKGTPLDPMRYLPEEGARPLR